MTARADYGRCANACCPGPHPHEAATPMTPAEARQAAAEALLVDLDYGVSSRPWKQSSADNLATLMRFAEAQYAAGVEAGLVQAEAAIQGASMGFTDLWAFDGYTAEDAATEAARNVRANALAILRPAPAPREGT